VCYCDELTPLNYHCAMHINCSPLYFHWQTVARKFSDHGWNLQGRPYAYTLIFSRVGACQPCSPHAGPVVYMHIVDIRHRTGNWRLQRRLTSFIPRYVNHMIEQS